jgi:hypothetical protein
MSLDNAVGRVLGHPEARILHDLLTSDQPLDTGIRALAERRRPVHIGLKVEDGDGVVEPPTTKEARSGDAGDDSDANRNLQRRHC